MKRTVLVTGGTGFLGRHLVARLVERGNRVLVTGREREPVSPDSDFLAEHFQDLTASQLRGLDAVYHLAAETNTRAPDAQQWRVNCEDAVEFLHDCKAANVPSIVYASSCAVYGRAPIPFVERLDGLEPLNAYGAAKLALDKSVQGWAVGIRPTNVFGPGEEKKAAGMSMVAEIVKRLRAGEPVTLFNTCSRDLVAVEDVADVFAVAAKFPPGAYNVGGGAPVDYLSVAIAAAGVLGVLANVERKACPFPFEFQEYTVASLVKLKGVMREAGVEYVPRPWARELRRYIMADWMLEPF